MKGFKPRPANANPPHTPTATKVYNELRRRILWGVLPADSLINEVQTADDLGVSRTPVRDALRELLNDGLLRDGPRRQCVVVAGSPELDREVRLMRTALETVAIREAALSHDVNGVDLLQLTMIRTRRALEAGEINQALDCDDEFHVRIAQVAGLPLVADTIHRLRGLVRLVGLERGWELADLNASADEHEAMIEAIAGHDPDSADKLLISHLNLP